MSKTSTLSKNETFFEAVCERLGPLLIGQGDCFSMLEDCIPEGFEESKIPKNGVRVMNIHPDGSPHADVDAYIFQIGEKLIFYVKGASVRSTTEYTISEWEVEDIVSGMFDFLT